jgi:tetratricopeptide (TPR) repeat protein
MEGSLVKLDAAVHGGSIAKLSMPRPAGIVRRPRVAVLVDRCLESGMCWIAAPGGYGKTTAVIDYVQGSKTPHVWYRVDDEDKDVARVFYYLAKSPGVQGLSLPVFGTEYAEDAVVFARLFLRAYMAHLEPGTVIVLDDIHRADTPEFREVLAVLLRELPNTVRCICISRTLPGGGVAELALAGTLPVIGQTTLEFSEDEARGLIGLREPKHAKGIDVAAARGWAVGLVMIANQKSSSPQLLGALPLEQGNFQEVLGRLFLQNVSGEDQDTLLKLNLLPEIRSGLADALLGPGVGGPVLERLFRMQLLVTRTGQEGGGFQFHDLLRDYLSRLFEVRLSPEEQASLREKAARVLRDAGLVDAAVSMALQAQAWPLARELIIEHAEAMLSQGRRATLVEWGARFPDEELDGWLLHWIGAAHVPDDAAAERWFSRAWDAFEKGGDLPGQWLTTTRAVLVKTSSWRTHDGLDRWTRRAANLLRKGLPELPPQDRMLVGVGMLRAVDYGEADEETAHAGERIADELLQQLADPVDEVPADLRLIASEALVDHAVWSGRQDIFEQAVDSVSSELGAPKVMPWVLGMWLVSFGSASGRYFSFSRRGFPYESAEDALRKAIEIGEREALRSVEFSGLYHLQLLLKLRNDFVGFTDLVARLSEIADSRFTTQVAVVADCRAAMHARQGNFVEAYKDCDRFMTAIEEANEPMVERWPHYVTKFQVLLADRRPSEAASLLTGIVERLDGGPRERVKVCILAAAAFEEKWKGSEGYAGRLAEFMAALRTVNPSAVLLNLPDLFAELLADALDRGIETDLCHSAIRTRRLVPPSRRPANWSWPLKVFVLGGFRIEIDGTQIDVGSKPPTRALDILRALSLARDQTCPLESLHDWLWPDLDGDQAKAACEQALHRLRKTLGKSDFIVQREGRVSLPSDKVWVDLADWEASLKRALSRSGSMTVPEKEELLARFPGPPLSPGTLPFWAMPAADKVRDGYIDLAIDVGKYWENAGDSLRARGAYLKALEYYPDSERAYQALILQRLSSNDPAGAVDDFCRYERAARLNGNFQSSAALRSLVRPYLKS